MSIQYYELADRELKRGIEKKEFRLIFQPIFNLTGDDFESLEVFIRWDHPILGALPPSLFFNRVSKAGMQGELTDYILFESVNACIHNLQEGFGWGVNINLTLEEVRNKRTLDFMLHAANHLPEPDKLCLEISPDILTAYAKYAQLTGFDYDSDPRPEEEAYLRGCKEFLDPYLEAGVTIASDSFDCVAGAIKRAGMLGMHAVKISKNILEKDSLADGDYLRRCAKIAKEMNVTLIAVGVDNAGLLKHVMRSNIEFAQGLLLSAPGSLEALKKRDHSEYQEAKRTLMMLSKSEAGLRSAKSNLQEARDDFAARPLQPQPVLTGAARPGGLAGVRPAFGKKTQ